MKLKKTGDPNILEIPKGGGCLMIIGLPFLFLGIFIISLPFGWIVPIQKNGPPLLFISIVGGFFFLLGFFTAFYRGGIIFDLRKRLIFDWWGLLFPLSQKEFKMDHCQKVTITKEIRRSKNSTYTVYPVKILLNEKKIHLNESRDFHVSRQTAEKFAKFLNIPIGDFSADEEIIREPETLDISVRDAFRRNNIEVNIPPHPKDMRSRVSQENGSLTVEIPASIKPQGMILVGTFFVFLGLIGLGPVVVLTFLGKIPVTLFCFLSLSSLLPVALISLFLIPVLFKELKLTVSRHEFRIQEKLFNKTKEIVIPGNELEEFLIIGTGRKKIAARSDRINYEFGSFLSSQELEYLHALMLKAITT